MSWRRFATARGSVLGPAGRNTGMSAAICSGAFALPALEGPVECRVALISDALGHFAGRIVALAEQLGCLGHPPSAQVLQRRLPDGGAKAGSESGPREADGRRERLDGPRFLG